MEIAPNPQNVISVSQIGTIVAQMRKEKWYASQNIFSLNPYDNFKKLISLYSISAINKSLSGSFSDGYGNYPTLEKLRNLEIQLPTHNGQIDFDFMESFIAELDAERLAELDAYLQATGLSNYILTAEEEKILKDFEDGKVDWRKLSITDDVFDVKNSGNILSREIIENSWNTPYLCASGENNGVSSYISYDEESLDEGKCIFIWGKTFIVTYQEKDFYSNDSHNLILTLKDKDKIKKLNQIFLVSCIKKSLGYKYSWWDSISNKKIQKDEITLPLKNSEPDYAMMEIFISAIQKLVIKEVVLYTDRKIAATRKVTGL